MADAPDNGTSFCGLLKPAVIRRAHFRVRRRGQGEVVVLPSDGPAPRGGVTFFEAPGANGDESMRGIHDR